MELRHFRYFLAVVEQGSFTRAAQALHISQPTLSQQIRVLEREVGATLLVREPGGIAPTASGAVFYEHVVAILAATADAVSAARHRAAGPRTLRIGIAGPLPGDVQVPVISAFKAAFPEVRTAWRALELNELDRPLLDGDVDVALIRLPVDPERLDWEVLVDDEPRAVLVPAGHPLAEAGTLTLDDVIDAAFVAIADSVPLTAQRWWTFYEERNHEDARFLGEPVDTVAAAALSIRLNGVPCPGPFALRDTLAPSGIETLPMTGLSPTVTVAARRRSDEGLPEVFCELAARTVRELRAAGAI
ncbi:LysR family transcriptional regulator [Actinomadura sp. NPDC048032]|uniref:LysR family transcriptional regulator n=1 Tax=Actinomadura sp. NPDC048032 TaxID=3155747 RepID=UPI0033E8732F